MKRWGPLCLAFIVSACSNAPVRIESRALAAQVSRSPDHFIIAAVDNETAVFVASAGSTPRGYGSLGAYGASPTARQTLRFVENDYGLREGRASPLAPLPLH